MTNPPTLPHLLVCYEHGDTDAQAARLVEDLRELSGFDNVATCYDYGPYYLRHLLRGSPHHPLVLIVVVGPAFDHPTPPEPSQRAAVLERIKFTIDCATEGRRPIGTLLVGGPVEWYGRILSGELHMPYGGVPPVEIRDDHWREDLTERFIQHLPPELLQRPAEPEGEAQSRPTAQQLEDYLIREYQRQTSMQCSVNKEWRGFDSYLKRGDERGAQLESAGGEPEAAPTGAGGEGVGAGAPSVPGRDVEGPEAEPPIIVSGGTSEDAPPQPAPTSAPPADVVECTVFAPPEVRAGADFLVQVFAHLTHEDAAVARLAKEADDDAEKRGSKSLDAEVGRGSRLTFHLRVPGMEVDDPVQHLVWRGEPEAVQFGVRAGAAHGGVIATVTVSRGEVPFGHVKFKLTVAAEPAAPGARDEEARAAQSWARYRKAFISYASKDRDEVLKRVQMLARLRIDFFQDLLSLEPGERWERALYRHIDESDVFFLFWSTAARDSEWVLREIRYALDRRGGDEFKPPEIVPVIIEGPPLVKPPPELDDLHFNDQILYFINRQGGAQ